MGMKTMVTKSLAVSMVGVVAVMSTAKYKGDLKTTLESNLSDLQTMLAGYSAKFKDQKRQIAQYVAQIGANETTINNLQDQVTSLTADKNNLTTERNDLKSKLTSIATLLGISLKDDNGNDKTMDVLVKDISDNITNGAEVSSDELATFKTIAKNLGKTEDEVASMSRNQLVVFINSEVSNLNTELDSANTEIARYEGEIKSANAEIKKLEGEVGKLQAEIKRLEGIIQQYEADLGALNTKAETIKNTYKEEYNKEIKGENGVDVLDKPGSNPEQTPIGGGTPEQQPAKPEKTAKEQAWDTLEASLISAGWGEVSRGNLKDGTYTIEQGRNSQGAIVYEVKNEGTLIGATVSEEIYNQYIAWANK